MSNDPDEANPVAGRAYTTPAIGGGGDVAARTTQQIAGLTSAMNSLSQVMGKVQQQASSFSTTVGGVFSKIGAGAQSAASSMSSLGNVTSSMFGTANEKGWVRDFMMFPTRFMRGNIEENRQLALSASAALGPQAFATGTSTQSMMRSLSGQFGNIIGGNPQDLLNLMNVASRVGAGVNWGAQGPNAPGVWSGGGGPRTAGFMRSVYEAQRISPGTEVGQLAGMIGGYAGNVGAQQQAAFLTGGAFSMIGAGNKQKSISEWAEGILKWLSNLRPGGERGKAFSYGELMSQNFPGSNIDAWLSANGVTEDMKQFFWSYAMAKSGQAGGTADDLFSKNEAVNQSVAFQRLQASGASTRTGFALAGQMAGAYANKEQANRWMAELMGHMMNEILPAAMSSGMLSYMQYLPDTIEEMIMQLAERTNLGTLGAGVVGWGSQFPEFLGAGDVGDIGDFGSYGATTTAGLHPDMKRRVDSMMEANPNIRVTSGLRDLGTQRRLRRQGVGKVSGKPSAHTRGLAADLGPRSQYPWIVANARKFGLSSGANKGEPWHVGLGDIGDPLTDAVSASGGALAVPGMIKAGQDLWNMGLMESIGSLFSGLFQSAFSVGGSPESQIAGISGGISNLMKGMMGIFARGEVDPERLKFRDVYAMMVEGTNKAPGLTVGPPTGGGNWWSDIIKNIRSRGAGTAAADMGGGGEFPGGGGAVGTAGITPPEMWAKFDSPDKMTRGVAVVHALYAAGFRGDELAKMATISWGESNWNYKGWADASTGDRDDIGGGLFGINVKPYVDKGMPWPWSKAEIQDPYRSAQIAMNDFYRGRGYDPWSTRQGGRHEADIANGNAARAAAGLGDMDYGFIAQAPAPSGPPAVIFHNNFTIQGGSGTNGGIDMRRTVTILADQLEEELKRRVARSN